MIEVSSRWKWQLNILIPDEEAKNARFWPINVLMPDKENKISQMEQLSRVKNLTVKTLFVDFQLIFTEKLENENRTLSKSAKQFFRSTTIMNSR